MLSLWEPEARISMPGNDEIFQAFAMKKRGTVHIHVHCIVII